MQSPPHLPRGLGQPPGQGLQGVEGADAQVWVRRVPDSRRGSRHNIQEPGQQGFEVQGTGLRVEGLGPTPNLGSSPSHLLRLV